MPDPTRKLWLGRLRSQALTAQVKDAGKGRRLSLSHQGPKHSSGGTTIRHFSALSVP